MSISFLKENCRLNIVNYLDYRYSYLKLHNNLGKIFSSVLNNSTNISIL